MSDKRMVIYSGQYSREYLKECEIIRRDIMLSTWDNFRKYQKQYDKLLEDKKISSAISFCWYVPISHVPEKFLPKELKEYKGEPIWG